MTNLVWFRSDLRTADNLALKRALESGAVIGCMFMPIDQLRNYGHGDNKISFLRSACNQLKNQLENAGIPFIYEEVSGFKDQIVRVREVCLRKNIDSVFWNNEYPFDERTRDSRLARLLSESDVQINRFDDGLIIPPGLINNNQGEMYRVFTPFKNAWLTHFNSHKQEYRNRLDKGWLTQSTGTDGKPISAERRLLHFCSDPIRNYQELRDLPAILATSRISADLSAGTISPLRVLGEALRQNNGETESGNPGILTWVNQLIWREFYYQLIARQNRLSKNKAFQPKTEQIQWNRPAVNFKRWCDGQTGVPIVDAGMRQLNQTGWMHNRLRMITAMFLTKNLLIDWRLGERYFLNKLVDGDFALNNGGWQWSASTGTDAAPYFRVFNPFSQAKRFDPKAVFIKQYVPELSSLPAELIHSEQKLQHSKPEAYAAALVDTKESRLLAIEAFSQILKPNSPANS